MIRLAVFDLDGTLVDSRRDLADAANALVIELGGAAIPERAIGDMVGEGAAVLVRRVLTEAGLKADVHDALPRFLALYDARLFDHTRPYDGIVETLETLRARLPLAVLTNKPQAATDRMLEGLGLARFFRAAIGGDTALGRKPDPAGLIELAGRAGVDAGSTVLVGDSPIDLETARRAGTRVVIARYGFGYRDVELRSGEVGIADPRALADLF
ncbi:MAG TPA: HAD-IA family hydrolase [Vicinamibacterales bacterium]|nr:HAD-IA family hydrolase [Vicinamibacterales bacterium]